MHYKNDFNLHFYLPGTIPTTIAYLTTAKSIYLHSNSFTGSIPRQLFLMPEVRDIQIQNNFLTGTIPSDIGAHSLLHEFQAHNNYLMGTIPSSIANLSFLYRISLANNFLTGPFVVPIRFTQQLDVTNNLLTGPISHMFVNLTLTQYLYFSENYFTGTIPEVISNYPQLVHLFLYDNLFTGTLPMFENCKFLETLLIQDNMFTGRPDDFLRAAGSLQVLDMSRNRFDKQLPREIWQLPKLRYVSIVETCSDGTIPREICDSSSLSVLILEGVRSGYGCREAYWDPTHFLLENAYYVESINSIVPDCIWTLSKLNTLHLSGNTLHGTIPDLINLPNLQSLSLSHNQFSGTIPALLSRSTRLMNFDLSHNKFSGTCNGFNDTDRGFIVPTGAMKLNVNRLSGDIPRTFFNSFDILDVLSGNVLTCSASRIELPDRDVERDNYTCGSNVFDISVILWICVIGTAVGCFLLVAGIVRYNCGRARLIIGVRDYIYSKKRELAVWGEYLDNESTIKAMPNFCKLIIVLKHFRKFINYLAIIILILYGIMYITAKLVLGWTTHKYQYRWLVTSAYMSSEQAAIWMLVLLCGLLAYASWGLLDITKVCSGISRTSKTSRDISTSYENRKELVTRGRISFKAVLYAFVLVVSHISIILAIKIAIIYSIVWSEVTANQKIALQLIMSFFDIVWNSTVIPLSCDMFQNLLQSDYRINLILLLLLFNSIVGPMLATAAVDRNCFSNLYKTEDPIESTYSQEYCSRFLSVFQAVDGSSTCDRTDVFYLSTTFDPPFTYSYACSSALITTFLPSLIFTYTLTIVLSPVVYSSLVAINGISERPRLCRFLTRAFPIVFFPYVETDFNNEALKIPMLSVKVLVARLLHNLAVMLTFGITCPFLALVISVETFCKTTMWMYLYGRYLYICSNGIIISENGPSKADVLLRFTLFFDRLEISCKDVWTGPAKSLHVILVHACLFSFILLMDIAGDKIGWKRALFRFCIPVMSLPLIFYIVHHLVQNTQLVPSFQNSASITTIGKVELRNTNSISTVRSPLVDLEHRRDTSDHQQELT